MDQKTDLNDPKYNINLVEYPEAPDQPMLSAKNRKDPTSSSSTFTIPKLRKPAIPETEPTIPDHEEVMIIGKNKNFDQTQTTINVRESKKIKERSLTKDKDSKNRSKFSNKKSSIDAKTPNYHLKVSSEIRKFQDKRGSSRVESKRGSLESQLEATYCRKSVV